jgi:hypothetical protein
VIYQQRDSDVVERRRRFEFHSGPALFSLRSCSTRPFETVSRQANVVPAWEGRERGESVTEGQRRRRNLCRVYIIYLFIYLILCYSRVMLLVACAAQHMCVGSATWPSQKASAEPIAILDHRFRYRSATRREMSRKAIPVLGFVSGPPSSSKSIAPQKPEVSHARPFGHRDMLIFVASTCYFSP